MEKLFIGKLIIFLFLLCLLLVSVDYFTVRDTRNSLSSYFTSYKRTEEIKIDLDSCRGRYIYVHHIPQKFNDDVLKNCQSLVKWFDMCPYIKNSGLGAQVENPGEFLLNKSWFSTSQFLLEVIFRNRMKQYECLTNDSALASAVYIPYYPGLDIGRHLWDFNISMRDASAYDIIEWVANKPEWKRRPAWDLRRKTDNESDWGSKLMSLPESMNMTMLSIESSSWSNEFAIPYPTHFHPSTKIEILEWQKRMGNRKRQYLYSFAGAPRPGMGDSIRGEIIRQCLASTRICKLLDCSSDGKCDNPVEVMKVFQDSIFCLQPPGDPYTRRSTFDSILAGCIPVFFHPRSAYTQYIWHLPGKYDEYSLFIPMNQLKSGNVIKVNETLLDVSYERILSMRDQVLGLMPKVVYADPRSNVEQLEDAFSLAVRGILERIETVRKKMNEGKDPSTNFAVEEEEDTMYGRT